MRIDLLKLYSIQACSQQRRKTSTKVNIKHLLLLLSFDYLCILSTHLLQLACGIFLIGTKGDIS